MPRPVLQAMVLADHIYQDRITGKFVIAGTFGTILVLPTRSKPSEPEAAPETVRADVVGRAGSPFLYLALFEVHGQVELDLKYVDLSDASVLFEGRVTLVSSDPLAVAEYTLPMPPLPANKVGIYSLDLLYEGEILGSWRVSVRELESDDESGAES